MNQSESGIDELVKVYLQTRGYHKALEALKEETIISTSTISQPTSLLKMDHSNHLTNNINTSLHEDHGRSKETNGKQPAISSSSSSLVSSELTEKNIEKLLLNAAESFCFLGVKQGDIESYQKEYDILYSWMFQSLDGIKIYLQGINFALFVYCYIGMIRFGHSIEANRFWELYSNIFMVYFQSELDQLVLLQSKDQLEDEQFLKSNSFIYCAIYHKFIIHINTFAFNLFTYFLSHNELILLASIINDKIQFQKLVNDQVNMELDCNALVELQNYTPGHNENPMNSNPLFNKIPLGVPGKGELLQALKEKSMIFREITIPDIHKETLYKVWIDKLIRPKATLLKILQNNSITSSSGLSTIPSSNNLEEARRKFQKISTTSPNSTSSLAPKLNREKEKEKDGDASANNSPQKIPTSLSQDNVVDGVPSSSSNTRSANKEEPADNTWTSLEVNPKSSTISAPKGNPLEPSIIFTTISNCEESLICLRVNDAITQVSTGYRDSIVRIWRLDENANEEYDDSRPYQSVFGKNLKDGRFEFSDVIPKPKEAYSNEYTNKQNHRTQRKSGSLGASTRHRYPMIEFKGHSGPVYSVDQNSTDRLILSSAADESIRLWDTAVLQCVGKYISHSISWDVQFNPIIDYYFASANQDSTVTLYSTDRTIPLRMMTGHISDVNCLSWHGNNTYIASGSDDRTVRLWDIRSAQCNRLLKGSNSAVTAVSICGVGNLLAAGNELGKIYLYDLRTSRILSVLHGHDSSVYSLAFNEDISTLVSGSHDCSVRVWDLLPAYETSFISTAAYQVNAPISTKNGAHSIGIGSGVVNAASGSTALSGIASNVGSSSGVAGSILGIVPTKNHFENYVTKVIKSKHTFFTKASPVYHVGFTKENLVFAGGPCSFITAASSREKYLFQASNSVSNNTAAISEHEAVNILGISGPTTSNS